MTRKKSKASFQRERLLKILLKDKTPIRDELLLQIMEYFFDPCTDDSIPVIMEIKKALRADFPEWFCYEEKGGN